MDGLLPLAWYLKDEEHWELACRFVEWTLESADASGNFGPVASRQDYWLSLIHIWGIHHDLMDQEGIYRDYVDIRERSAGWSLT